MSCGRECSPNFDDLLTIGRRAELRAAINNYRAAFTLPQVQRLASRAGSLEPPLQPLRLGIIHTYTSELLDPWLTLSAALQGLKMDTYHAPYGLSLQEAHAASGLVMHEPDLTLLLLRREDVHPDLSRPL